MSEITPRKQPSFLRRLFFGERVLEADVGSGIFRRPTGGVYHYKPNQIKDYFSAYLDNDLIRGPVDDLVEQTIGDGYFTSVEKLTPKKRKSRSKDYIDAYGEVFNFDANLVNITRLNLIGGFCPVERKLVKGPPEKNSFRIVHPVTVTDILSEGGIVTKIKQKVGGQSNTIEGKNLAWFVYSPMGNDPRGVSYVRGMISLLNTLNEATDDVDRILKRYIGPLAIWKTRDDIDNIKQAVINREQGQDIFIGKMRQEDVENTSFPYLIQIDPRVPFWQYIEYLDRRIFGYTRASNIWYVRNATEASAREMDAIVQRHVKSIQRDIKRTVERDFFAPLAELNNLYEVPKMNFGVETTGVEDIRPDLVITKGLELGFISDAEYRFLLKTIGIDLGDHDDEEEEEEEPEIDDELEAEIELPEEDAI